MLLILSLMLSLAQSPAFRALVTVEEQGQKASHIVHVTEGALRIEPESEDLFLLIDVETKTVSLVDTKNRFFCRADGEELERLKDAKLLRESWFPWVYQVSPDLVENLEVRDRGRVRLPNGKAGRKVEVYSNAYDRVVAEYWVDPLVSGRLFFQWREVYLDLWSENGELDEAQQARLEIYDQLKGLPWRMEERFRLLTQPRILVIEEWRAAQQDSWSVPDDYAEKSVAQLIWENLIHRLENWIRPKSLPSESRSWTSRVR